MCKKNSCSEYFSGPSAKKYLNYDLFKKNNLNIILQDCKDIQYKQIGNDWSPRLSILDTLFMLGPKKTRFFVENLNSESKNNEN